MNYDKIILELLDRIKELEEKVARLENKDAGISNEGKSICIRSSEYGDLTNRARNYITCKKDQAKNNGETELVLLANDIQKALGVRNRVPCICQAMYDQMEDGDEVLFAPPSGKSTTVLIKYYIK